MKHVHARPPAHGPTQRFGIGMEVVAERRHQRLDVGRTDGDHEIHVEGRARLAAHGARQ